MRDNDGYDSNVDYLSDFNSVNNTSRIYRSSTEPLIKQINDLKEEVIRLREENDTFKMRFNNLSFTEQAKSKINNLEAELNDLNFEGKCIETIKKLSDILVSFIFN